MQEDKTEENKGMIEHNESTLMNLTSHLLFEIVSKVGEGGFEESEQIISSCRVGRAVGKNKEVLKRASLKMVEQIPELINMGSAYMTLFYRCFKAHNPSAIYLESLRSVAQLGYTEDACNWLNSVNEQTMEKSNHF